MATEKKMLIVNPKNEVIEVDKKAYDFLITRRLYKEPTADQKKAFKEK